MDGVSKVSFKFLHTLWVYRTCIGLLIYMFKNCHQLCYGFENLMSSWRVWISFSKLLWGNVFLKNHAKSKVFQNNRRPQAFFVKIWCQVGKLGYNSHGRKQSFRSFDQALTSPSRALVVFFIIFWKCHMIKNPKMFIILSFIIF